MSDQPHSARRRSSEAISLGVDVGGTFTDAALGARGRIFTAKVPTTPVDQSQGVMSAVDVVLARAGVRPQDVTHFGHGMTVATNALLEERGARTALVATRGFSDVVEIARQARADLYRLCRAAPRPLVPADLRFELIERVAPGGVLEPLDDESLAGVVERVAEQEVEAVAIALLHSYAEPSHERRAAQAIAARLPELHVSASHDVLGVFREYERTSTTVIDAYLSPLLARYLSRLTERAVGAGLPQPEIMRSSGGLMPAREAARHAAWTVLSGPAAGAVGAAWVGRLSGSDGVVTFDMGGTSCDVSVVDGGRVRQAAEQKVAGRVLQLPMVDVHTVGAGGGSIAWADPGGALRVGPHSAGADPGPACYGRGGKEPTVTDANLLLGYLGADSTLAGGVRLDADAAERAVQSLARNLGLARDEASLGIVRVADQEMMRALRVVTVERGVDPRAYALLAFGGAGPMHAVRIAQELGIGRVLCPRAAGVLSALGLVVSDRRRDFARSVLLGERQLAEGAATAAVEELTSRAREELPGARIDVLYDLRYSGQSHELTVIGPQHPDAVALRAKFEREHTRRYGYADPQAEIQLVNVRVAAVGERVPPPLAVEEPGPSAVRDRRRARFTEGWLDATVLHGDLAPAEAVEGPAICELPEATVLVPPRWKGEVDRRGTLVLEHAR